MLRHIDMAEYETFRKGSLDGVPLPDLLETDFAIFMLPYPCDWETRGQQISDIACWAMETGCKPAHVFSCDGNLFYMLRAEDAVHFKLRFVG